MNCVRGVTGVDDASSGNVSVIGVMKTEESDSAIRIPARDGVGLAKEQLRSKPYSTPFCGRGRRAGINASGHPRSPSWYVASSGCRAVKPVYRTVCLQTDKATVCTKKHRSVLPISTG